MKQDWFFYGWVIVGVSFINLGIIFGLWYSFSVFFVAIAEEFQWSRAATSGVFSCFILVHSISGVLVGSVMDRFGPRRVIPAAACIVALGLVASSRIGSLWELYLWYGVVTAVGVCAIGFIAHGMIIPKWFDRKRGLAIGIAMAGIGLGMQVLVPAAQYLIIFYGWRSAYLIFAVFIMCTLFPLNMLLQKNNPQEIGEVPDGRNRRDSRNTNSAEKYFAKPSLASKPLHPPLAQTTSEALRTRQFWFLFASFFFAPLAIQGTLIHQVASVTDKGFSPVQGAFFFGMAGIVGSAGKIFFGMLSDRIGRKKAFTLGVCCAILGVISLLLLRIDRPYLLYTYAILFGLGYGAIAPIIPSQLADLFLGPHFGKILGIFSLAGGVGGATGVFLSGKIFDLTQDYTLAFIIALGAMILTVMLFRLSCAGGNDRKPDF